MDWLLLLMPLTSCAFALLFWTPLIALVGMYYAGMWWSAAILALYIPLYVSVAVGSVGAAEARTLDRTAS